MADETSPLSIPEQERAELRAVLQSKLFTRAPRLAEFLSYICQKRFDGQADQIKELTIAVELFNRSATEFVSRDDTIVRVDANRLRRRLKRYYRSEGKDHWIQISIPPGRYAPVFQRRAVDSAELREGEEDEATPVPAGEGEAPAGSEVSLQLAESSTLALHLPSGPEGGKWGRFLRFPRWVWLIAVGVVVVAGAVASTRLLLRGGQAVQPTSRPATSERSASNPQGAGIAPGSDEIRILAGSSSPEYVDNLGRVWVGDRYFSGGEVYTPLRTALLKADESVLCRAARAGDFRYDIPLKPGVYELRLYFAEIRYGTEPEGGAETTRRFNVAANGRPLLTDFDIISDAAGSGIVDTKVFTDISPAEDGMLHLVFTSLANGALLNGLEIVPGMAGRLRPIRITTRSSPYIASDGQVWEPDRFCRGGRTVTRLHPVEGTPDSELYQSERHGHFTYTIPVSSGRHQVTLKFAETYFVPANFLGSGVGMRLFNVECNGQMLLKNFDIAREAGENRAWDKVFHGIEPDPQGKIVIHFSPVKNYACICAIEVMPE